MTVSSAFCIGLVQMTSGCEVERNLRDCAALVREAHAAGAEFIATPEMTNILDVNRERLAASVEDEKTDRAPCFFAELAQRLDVYLLIGSMALKEPNGKLVNRSLLFTPQGEVAGRYDKIHMFDVELGNGRKFRESRTYQAGGRAVIAQLPWTRLGMTICYDVRFSQLYRSLARASAYLISVPSAFTVPTGEAHWKVLMRARAIENAAFIAAPAQTGLHECGRETYGHSLLVDPWGEVVCEGGDEPGTLVARIDPQLAAIARRRIPSLFHSQPSLAPILGGQLKDAP
jgi:predicted amidohydrolase